MPKKRKQESSSEPSESRSASSSRRSSSRESGSRSESSSRRSSSSESGGRKRKSNKKDSPRGKKKANDRILDRLDITPKQSNVQTVGSVLQEVDSLADHLSSVFSGFSKQSSSIDFRSTNPTPENNRISNIEQTPSKVQNQQVQKWANNLAQHKEALNKIAIGSTRTASQELGSNKSPEELNLFTGRSMSEDQVKEWAFSFGKKDVPERDHSPFTKQMNGNIQASDLKDVPLDKIAAFIRKQFHSTAELSKPAPQQQQQQYSQNEVQNNQQSSKYNRSPAMHLKHQSSPGPMFSTHSHEAIRAVAEYKKKKQNSEGFKMERIDSNETLEEVIAPIKDTPKHLKGGDPNIFIDENNKEFKESSAEPREFQGQTIKNSPFKQNLQIGGMEEGQKKSASQKSMKQPIAQQQSYQKYSNPNQLIESYYKNLYNKSQTVSNSGTKRTIQDLYRNKPRHVYQEPPSIPEKYQIDENPFPKKSWKENQEPPQRSSPRYTQKPIRSNDSRFESNKRATDSEINDAIKVLLQKSRD